MLISLTCVVRKDQLFQSFLFSNLYLKKNLVEKKFMLWRKLKVKYYGENNFPGGVNVKKKRENH